MTHTEEEVAKQLYAELADVTRELMEHLETYCSFPDGPVESTLSRNIYAALGDAFTCSSCGREESECSANPCEGVVADREVTA